MEKCGNIYIEEPESEFKRVYKGIINSPNIDCLTLGIYVKILVLGKKWQLNIKGLSSHFGISDTKIRKSISLLEHEGYISRKAVQDEKTGKLAGWNYTLYSIPLDESKRTCAGRSNVEETVYPENRQHGYPTTRLSDNTENGEDNIYKLNRTLNLKEKDKLNGSGMSEKEFSHNPASGDAEKSSASEEDKTDTCIIEKEKEEKNINARAARGTADCGGSPATAQRILSPSYERKTSEQGNVQLSVESSSEAKKTASAGKIDINSPYGRFVEWQKKNTPTVLKMKKPITEEEYHRIRADYSYDQLTSILLDMENYAPLTKKYTSANLTFRKWAKREYGSN